MRQKYHARSLHLRFNALKTEQPHMLWSPEFPMWIQAWTFSWEIVGISQVFGRPDLFGYPSVNALFWFPQFHGIVPSKGAAQNSNWIWNSLLTSFDMQTESSALDSSFQIPFVSWNNAAVKNDASNRNSTRIWACKYLSCIPSFEGLNYTHEVLHLPCGQGGDSPGQRPSLSL